MYSLCKCKVGQDNLGKHKSNISVVQTQLVKSKNTCHFCRIIFRLHATHSIVSHPLLLFAVAAAFLHKCGWKVFNLKVDQNYVLKDNFLDQNLLLKEISLLQNDLLKDKVDIGQGGSCQ